MLFRGEEIFVHGNKGGDELMIRILSQDDDTAMIHLKVGSSCVYGINHIMPVELLTSLLTIALGYGDVEEKAQEWLEWSPEVNQGILDRIARWCEFDDWWFKNERVPADLREAFRQWQEQRNAGNL